MGSVTVGGKNRNESTLFFLSTDLHICLII